MNPTTSKAFRRAREIHDERNERDFRRRQLETAMPERWADLKAEVTQLVRQIAGNVASYKDDLHVKDDGDLLAFWTKRGTLTLERDGEHVVLYRDKSKSHERSFSVYYTKPSEDSHRPEWRDSEKGPGLTSETLADVLVLELLDLDNAADSTTQKPPFRVTPELAEQLERSRRDAEARGMLEPDPKSDKE